MQIAFFSIKARCIPAEDWKTYAMELRHQLRGRALDFRALLLHVAHEDSADLDISINWVAM